MNVTLRPQQGFQESALTTSADIAVLGGAAGSGKTYALLLECLRHIENPRFGGTIFRRNYQQIIMEGGLLDESRIIFSPFGAVYNESKHQWKFPSGAKISFRHLQYEKNIYDYQGAQIPFIAFDEFTHFNENMFLYLLSRNRSTSGVKPYIRATCNPDPESFVYKLVEWYIDPVTGFPIPERDGVMRYFINDAGVYIWGNTKQEVVDQAPHIFDVHPVAEKDRFNLIKSFTFIKGSINDNKELLSKDPAYLANLMSQTKEQKSRLLDGNWKFIPDEKRLMDIPAIADIFANEIFYKTRVEKFVVIDHARFGKDYCTIIYYENWKAVKTVILSQSDTDDIVNVVNDLRKEFGIIPPRNILVDQDGIGVKDKLKCEIFIGSSQPFKVNKAKTKHRNKKTQCWFHLADKVNDSEVYYDLNNVWKDGRKVKAIKYKTEMLDLKNVITDDLKTMKRASNEDEFVYRLISKEEQKIALQGRSPDIGDNLAMRSYFDLRKTPKKLR